MPLDIPATEDPNKPAAAPEPAPTPELSPRQRALQEIVDATAGSHENDNETFRQTVQVVDEDGQPVAAEPAAAPAEAVPPEAPTDAPADTPAVAAPVADAPFDPAKEYELVVDGHTIKVPGAKIVEMGKRSLQKEAAADLRLQLASRLLAEAEQRAKAAQAAPAPQPQPSAPVPEAPAGPTPAELAEAIQFGTKDQAAKAIEELSRRQGKQVTPEQVMGFVQSQLSGMVASEIEFRDAAKFVQSEYSDIMSNAYLKDLFFLEEDKRRRAGDNRSYKDLYKAIGDDLRAALKLPAPSAAPTPPKTLEDKKQEKIATTPPVPRTAATRLEGAPAQKAPTQLEILNQMRAGRHQPRL